MLPWQPACMQRYTKCSFFFYTTCRSAISWDVLVLNQYTSDKKMLIFSYISLVSLCLFSMVKSMHKRLSSYAYSQWFWFIFLKWRKRKLSHSFKNITFSAISKNHQELKNYPKGIEKSKQICKILKVEGGVLTNHFAWTWVYRQKNVQNDAQLLTKKNILNILRYLKAELSTLLQIRKQKFSIHFQN